MKFHYPPPGCVLMGEHHWMESNSLNLLSWREPCHQCGGLPEWLARTLFDKEGSDPRHKTYMYWNRVVHVMVNVKIRQEVNQYQSFIYTALPRPRKSRLTWGGKRQKKSTVYVENMSRCRRVACPHCFRGCWTFSWIGWGFSGEWRASKEMLWNFLRWCPRVFVLEKVFLPQLQMGVERRSRWVRAWALISPWDVIMCPHPSHLQSHLRLPTLLSSMMGRQEM